MNPHSNNARAVIGLWQSAMEWRAKNGTSVSSITSKSSSTRQVAEIDDDNDLSAPSADEGAVAAESGSSAASAAAPTLTLALANQLITLAEGRLKQQYQNSPLLSVLELTLRRFGSATTTRS
jgi:hypothetical protein